MINTQRELRAEFWRQHPKLQRRVTRDSKGGYRLSLQNEYPTDTRVAWVDFVDRMHRDGQISDALAERATL